jgi:anti-sigma B factor antagonist
LCPLSRDTSAPVTDLQISAHNEGDLTVLTVSGEVDAATTERFRAALVEVQGLRVVVDLSGVTFLDSAGISALIAARHRLPSGGELRVIGLRPNVRRVLEITGLLDFFNVDTPDDRPAPSSDG